MDTEKCEDWLQQYTIELNNILADKQRQMLQPKLHRAYSNLAAINHQSNPNFQQNEIILARITDFVNYVEHFHMIGKKVCLKALLNFYVGKGYYMLKDILKITYRVNLLKAIHIEIKLDTDEWSTMKFSMYEVIELFRSPEGIRANVAIKILMVGLIAIKENAKYHAQIMQR